MWSGEYKTLTPGPWTLSVDQIHGLGPSKYGLGRGPPIFTSPCKQRPLVYDRLYILVKCFVVNGFEITKFAMCNSLTLGLQKRQCQL